MSGVDKRCEQILEQLADGSVRALAGARDVREHLLGCPDCAQMAEALAHVERAAKRLPVHEPPAASIEAILAATDPAHAEGGGVASQAEVSLGLVDSSGQPMQSPQRASRRRELAGSLAALAAAAAAVLALLYLEGGAANSKSVVARGPATSQSPPQSTDDFAEDSDEKPETLPGVVAPTRPTGIEFRAEDTGLRLAGRSGEEARTPLNDQTESEFNYWADGDSGGEGRVGQTTPRIDVEKEGFKFDALKVDESVVDESPVDESIATTSETRNREQPVADALLPAGRGKLAKVESDKDSQELAQNDREGVADNEPADVSRGLDDLPRDRAQDLDRRRPFAFGARVEVNGLDLVLPDGREHERSDSWESPQSQKSTSQTLSWDKSGWALDKGEHTVRLGPSLADRFLATRSQREQLQFVEPRGYWANTYIPGDPSLRALRARLAASAGDPSIAFEAGAGRYRQPLDVPRSSALAVTVRADRRAAEGPERMLVQIALASTERRGARRSAMNVAVVLDMREPPDAETGAAMRALLDALRAARQPGDRFSLSAAGPGGGLLVSAAEFRSGSLAVATRALFGSAPAEAPEVSLADAVELATAQVLGSDDANAALGSSAVLLVTAARLDSELPRLLRMAHGNAVQGVLMSAVGVGTGSDPDQLGQLALAGQGNRRALLRAADASGIIERELTSVAAVVARAVRLRIRLAPGVQLVDVIGSHRLDEAGAERVRQAEQSIDRRMARTRGIGSDRGEDEDGIQIVIPSFYAADSHVILLDVVAPGPGPIADVTARYKDLVYLRNGVARDSLRLARGKAATRSAERGVLKNYVAQMVGAELRGIARQLAEGDRDGALAKLNQLGEFVAGAAAAVPALASDADLQRDSALIGRYADFLRDQLASGGEMVEAVARLVDSLRYAGWRKVTPVR